MISPSHKSTMWGYVDVGCGGQDQKLKTKGKLGHKLDTCGILISLVEAKAGLQELEDSMAHKAGLLEEE